MERVRARRIPPSLPARPKAPRETTTRRLPGRSAPARPFSCSAWSRCESGPGRTNRYWPAPSCSPNVKLSRVSPRETFTAPPPGIPPQVRSPELLVGFDTGADCRRYVADGFAVSTATPSISRPGLIHQRGLELHGRVQRLADGAATLGFVRRRFERRGIEAGRFDAGHEPNPTDRVPPI